MMKSLEDNIRSLISTEHDEKIIDYRVLKMREGELRVGTIFVNRFLMSITAAFLIPLVVITVIAPEKELEIIITGCLIMLVIIVLMLDIRSTIKDSDRMIYVLSVITSRKFVEIEHTEDTRHILMRNLFYEHVFSIDVFFNERNPEVIKIIIHMRDGRKHIRYWPHDFAKEFLRACRKYIFENSQSILAHGGVYL